MLIDTCRYINMLQINVLIYNRFHLPSYRLLVCYCVARVLLHPGRSLLVPASRSQIVSGRIYKFSRKQGVYKYTLSKTLFNSLNSRNWLVTSIYIYFTNSFMHISLYDRSNTRKRYCTNKTLKRLQITF